MNAEPPDVSMRTCLHRFMLQAHVSKPVSNRWHVRLDFDDIFL